MKILIADKFPASHAEQLNDLGHSCTVAPELDADSLVDAIADHDVLVVRSTRVTRDTFDAGKQLKLVIRAGAGTNTIDKDYASGKGITVCNVPGANAVAVAELVMGLLLCIDRNIPDNVIDLRQGQWDKKRYCTARGLYGLSLGILGLGAIGFAVAERAHAFGMEVCVVTKPERSEDIRQRIRQSGIVELDSQSQLLGHCDIVSLHLPATEHTRVMVDKAFLSAMKNGAILINTSRGELVDEQALLWAIESKGLRAGLDVYANEPAEGKTTFSSALASHPSVYGTHHIGASTDQAQVAVADGVIQVVDAFDNGEKLNCVNS